MSDEKETIRVNLDALTIGDLELFEDWGGGGEVRTKDVLDVLDRAVEGGVRHRPLSQLSEIVAAIQSEVGEASNPKN